MKEYLGSKDTYFSQYHLKNVLAFTCPGYAANAKGICSRGVAGCGCPSSGSAASGAALNQSMKAEVRGFEVVLRAQWCPPSCKQGSDGHGRGYGCLCPSAQWVRSQLDSELTQGEK